MLDKAGADIGLTTRWIALRYLSQYGVRVMTRTKAVEIIPQGLWVEKKEGRELIPCDTVVMACRDRPGQSPRGEAAGLCRQGHRRGGRKEGAQGLRGRPRGILRRPGAVVLGATNPQNRSLAMTIPIQR